MPNRPVPASTLVREGSTDDVEQDLLRRLKSGDRTAYRDAVEKYSPRMLGAARKIVGPDHAEDIVQDAWVTVVTRLDGFEERASFSTWIIRITTNRAISFLRSRSRETNLDDGEHIDPTSTWFNQRGRWATPPTLWDAGTPDELLSAGALQDCIEKHLASMPDNQRAVLVMRDLEQLPFSDICNELALSASNARVLLHRGRSRLLEMINGYQKTGTC